MLKNISSLSFVLVTIISLLSCSQENTVNMADKLIMDAAYDQALSLLDKEIQNNPENKMAHFAIANCLATKYVNNKIKGIKEETGLKKKVVYAYKKTLQIDPYFVDALFNLADFYFFNNFRQEAKFTYKKIFELNDKHTGIFMPLKLLVKGKSIDKKLLDKKLTDYFKNISTGEVFNIMPEQPGNTVVISCDNCTAVLKKEGKEDSSVKLIKYDVFEKVAVNGDEVTFIYETSEKLHDKDLKTAERYAITNVDNVIFGTGDIVIDKFLVYKIKNISFLNDEQKLSFISGKIYKGTPELLVNYFNPVKFQLTKKYYVKNICYEQWKDNRTQKVFIFKNNILEKMIE